MAQLKVGGIRPGATTEELIDYIIRLERKLDFVINGGLETDNVNRLYYEFASGASILIDRNGITINDGTENTFRADTSGNVALAGVITALAGFIGGWAIEGNSLSSDPDTYPRIDMDPSNKEFVFYGSANEYIRFGAFSITSNRPFLEFVNSAHHIRIDLDNNSFDIKPVGTSTTINITAGGDLNLDGDDIYLNPSSRTLQNFSKFEDPVSGETLDDKANVNQTGNYLYFDSVTKDLSLLDIDGNVLSTVNLT